MGHRVLALYRSPFAFYLVFLVALVAVVRRWDMDGIYEVRVVMRALAVSGLYSFDCRRSSRLFLLFCFFRGRSDDVFSILPLAMSSAVVPVCVLRIALPASLITFEARVLM